VQVEQNLFYLVLIVLVQVLLRCKWRRWSNITNCSNVQFQNTPQSQISDTIQSSSQARNNEPIKAYVVTNDITTAQELTRNTIESSTKLNHSLTGGFFMNINQNIYIYIYMEGKLNRYELVFDEETMEGVYAVSLVNDPAIQIEALMF
jgi:hypothetical protein